MLHRVPGAISPVEFIRLQELSARADARLSLRARIVLLADQGLTDAAIAKAVGTSRKTAWRWRTRFARMRLRALEQGSPRSGRKPILRDQMTDLILRTTLTNAPGNAACWSTRLLAKALGVSRGMVHRVWREFDIEPLDIERRGDGFSKDEAVNRGPTNPG